MSIHYKFKSSLEFDTVTFDGLHISVKDLKKEILQQKKIGKSTDFDLQITNAQTKEVYTDENELISKNTSLIVARVPIANPSKKQWDRDGQVVAGKGSDSGDGTLLGKSVDLVALDLPEEDKIQTMMSQSTSEYDPSNYLKVRGGNQYGPVPAYYVCHKCHQKGHWIKDCKYVPPEDGVAGDAIRKNSGIPRSFMIPVDGPKVPGARMTLGGSFAVPAIDHEVYKEKKIEKPPFLAEAEKPAELTTIPDDLQCVICKDLMQDAVMAPCCGNSFCDECIRSILVESDDAECPECNEKDVSPDTLIPNRFVRNKVNNFKNKTGYIKRNQTGNNKQSPPRPSLPDFVPPGSEKPVSSENGPTVNPENGTNDKDKPDHTNDVKNDPGADSLYDSAVQKDGTPKNEEKPSEESVADKSKSKRDNVSEEGGNDSQEGYTIPSILPANPSMTSRHPPRYHGPYRHGGERSGTPTVDERYEPYNMPDNMGPGHGPPGPGPGPGYGPPGYPGQLYNPHFPPPLLGNQEYGYRGRGHYRGRYPGRYNHHGYHHPPHGRPLPSDEDEAYRAFQKMLQEKEERDKRKQSRKMRGNSRSRSRSPRSEVRADSRSRSNGRSQSQERSPTHNKPFPPSRSASPNERRRSFSPRRSRSRSPRRSRSLSRPRSFVMSRSRSRSYEKSPVERKSPRRYNSPPRSPGYRYGREHYGDDYGWERDRRDRRGGYRPRGRPPAYYGSPPRHHSSYHRYDYESPARERYLSPDRYGEPHRRGHGGRWQEHRGRRPSISPHRGYYEEEHRPRREESTDRRSPSRSRRERSPRPDDHDRYRDRREKSRDRTREQQRRYSPEKGHDRDRKREPSPERRRVERSPTNQKSREPPKPSHSPSKSRKRTRSPVPKVEERVKSPSKSPLRKRKRSKTPIVDEPIVEAPAPHLNTSEEIARSSLSPSSVGDKTKVNVKKEKRKDKERKKKKKEKESEEEKEARRKRKREKKEKKKKLLEDQTAALPETEKVKQSPLLVSNVSVNDSIPSEVESSELNKKLVEEKEEVKLEKEVSDETLSNDMKKIEEGEIDESNEESFTKANDTDTEDVLDLNASYENLIPPEMLAPMPELSKWELEESGIGTVQNASSPDAPNASAVTSEVLKRAENAIFKKAISALRPDGTTKKDKTDVDNKKSERDKSQEKEKKKIKDENIKNRDSRAEEPPRRKEDTSSRSKTERLKKEVDEPKKSKDSDRVFREVPHKSKTDGRKAGNSIQITIPVAEEKEERAISFASEQKKNISPPHRPSIKDRLGGKVDSSSSRLPSSVTARLEERSVPSRRVMEESDFVPMYDNSSEDENIKRRVKVYKSRESSSSESSDDSSSKGKKKRKKQKKDKKPKKKSRKEETESSESSDSEMERKRHKKAKKKKKSRH